MKTFKLIDFYTQIILLTLFVCITVFRNAISFTIYTGVALWEMISVLVHIIKEQMIASYKERRTYSFLIAGLIVTIVFLHLSKADNDIIILISYLTLCMFLYYLHLCYREIFFYMKRPLSVLK